MAQPRRLLRRLIVGVALLSAAALTPLPTVTTTDESAVAAGVAVGGRDACGRLLRKPSGGRWRCSFVDEFDRRRLDHSKWEVMDTRKIGWWQGETCFTTGRESVDVRRGRLVLTARRGPLINCGTAAHSAFTHYTGGMVNTSHNFAQTYGRFEVRSKYPTADTQGIIGGFWMYPIRHTYGRWPRSGEIDVAEWWSARPRQVVPSLHYEGRERRVDSGFKCRVKTPTRFHTYTLVWRPTVMRFSIDGKKCFARRWTPDPPLTRPQPFDHPFSMILFVGVPWRWGGRGATAQTEFPARYVVDYAKAWR